MRIAVVGTGGVGGYFGGLLARSGEDVIFIARGEHLAAIRRNGLRVKSIHGDFVVAPAQATDNPSTIGPVDLVLLTTKTYQLDEAVRQMAPLLGAHTIVLPLQNGVDAADRVVALLAGSGKGQPAGRAGSPPSGPSPVLGGACWVVSAVTEPGVITQQSHFRRIVVGELGQPGASGSVSPRVQAIVAALTRAGATAEASPDIRKVLWTKFLFIACYSGLGAVTRVPAGELMASAEVRAVLEQAMTEVAAVAKAEGVELDPDVVPQTMTFCANLEPGATASMQR
ncbi:MAG TPA: 2-dehydropantoate 2-reductase, partial [Anaerolineae bacterium]